MKKKLILVGLFLLMIGMSFVSEWFPTFFGDFTCQGNKPYMLGHYFMLNGCQHTGQEHGPSTHWGFRHWVFVVMGLSLSVWGVVDLVNKEDNE